jgi:hypothetical protein
MDSKEVPSPVTPVNAGVYKWLAKLVSGLRRNDAKCHLGTFYESNFT